MVYTLKIAPNEDGRAIITLYGQDIDVTDEADKDGKGTLHFAGDDYNYEIVKNDKPTKKAAKKKVAEKVEVKNYNPDGTVEAEVDGETATLEPADEETKEALETLEEERDKNEA